MSASELFLAPNGHAILRQNCRKAPSQHLWQEQQIKICAWTEHSNVSPSKATHYQKQLLSTHFVLRQCQQRSALLTHCQLIEATETAGSWLCLFTMLEQQLLIGAGILLAHAFMACICQQLNSKLALRSSIGCQ